MNMSVKPLIHYAYIIILMNTYLCNILTWNIRGAMSSAGSLSLLLNKHDIDIACISEHKLKPNCVHFLDTLHSSYKSYTICENIHLNAKCGKGGVCILYKKQLSFSITELTGIESSRIAGVKLTIADGSSTPTFIFSVYLPSVLASSRVCMTRITMMVMYLYAVTLMFRLRIPRTEEHAHSLT